MVHERKVRHRKALTRKDFKYKRDWQKFEKDKNTDNEDMFNERYSTSIFGFLMTFVLVLFLWFFRFALTSPAFGGTDRGEDYPLLISITIILLSIPFFILGDEMSDSKNRTVKFWGNVLQVAFGIGFIFGMGYMVFN